MWQFVKDGDGLRSVPTLAFVDWRVAHQDSDRIVYRPSVRTFLRRLGIFLVCGLFAGALCYAVLRPFWQVRRAPVAVSPQAREFAEQATELETSLRDSMSEDEWNRYAAERDRDDADRAT